MQLTVTSVPACYTRKEDTVKDVLIHKTGMKTQENFWRDKAVPMPPGGENKAVNSIPRRGAYGPAWVVGRAILWNLTGKM